MGFLRVALAALSIGVATSGAMAAEPAVVIPAPALDAPVLGPAPRSIVLAGGCFWGVQGVFEHTKGVTRAVSGYSGGKKETAHYEMVGTGRTGHAESVSITYDPQQISYGKILQIYFSVAHDPTQLNRQGPDFGTQYRSAIFYTDDAQKRVADAYIAQLGSAKAFRRPIVTQVAPLTQFFPAEAYHQDYVLSHPTQLYIVVNDLPKVDNFKRLFMQIYREAPVTVTVSGKAS